jgi:ATP-binding cassette, subfamily A (ABC1), member 3
MANGQLHCAGSSLFLKNFYGVGYQLTIEKKQERDTPTMSTTASRNEIVGNEDSDDSEVFGSPSDSNNLNHLVFETIPEASLLHDAVTEVKYRLPFRCADKFVNLFERLDVETIEGNVVSYGVSMTTLGTCYKVVVGDYVYR